MDLSKNDKHGSKRADTWLTTKEVVGAIGGSISEVGEKTDGTVQPIVETLGKKHESTKPSTSKDGPNKKLGAIIWLAATAIVSFGMALGVSNVYTRLFPQQQEVIGIHSAFGFVLTVFFSFGAYYIHRQKSKPRLLVTIGMLVYMFFVVFFILFVPLWFKPPLDSIGKIEDLFRIVTICFAILAADCAIPPLVKKNEEGQKRDLLSIASFFLVGTCAAATLVLALFAKNDMESIVFVGRMCVFYCLGCLLFTIQHFLYISSFLKNILLILSDTFGRKKK